jgi:hypothetical protein
MKPAVAATFRFSYLSVFFGYEKRRCGSRFWVVIEKKVKQ